MTYLSELDIECNLPQEAELESYQIPIDDFRLNKKPCHVDGKWLCLFGNENCPSGGQFRNESVVELHQEGDLGKVNVAIAVSIIANTY